MQSQTLTVLDFLNKIYNNFNVNARLVAGNIPTISCQNIWTLRCDLLYTTTMNPQEKW